MLIDERSPGKELVERCVTCEKCPMRQGWIRFFPQQGLGAENGTRPFVDWFLQVSRREVQRCNRILPRSGKRARGKG